MCPTDDYTYQKCVDCGKNFPSKDGDTRCNPCKRELINKPLDVLESIESACRPSFAKTRSNEIDERIADYTQQIDDLEKTWLDGASEIQNFQSAIESLMEKIGNRKKAGDRKTSMEFTDDAWATIYDSLSCASEYHQYKMDSEIKGLRLDLAQKIKGEWVLDAWGYPLFPLSAPSVNSSPAKQLQAIEKVLGLVVKHEKPGAKQKRHGLLIFTEYAWLRGHISTAYFEDVSNNFSEVDKKPAISIKIVPITHDAAVNLLAERWNWSAEVKDDYGACGKAIRGWRKELGKYIQYGRDMYAEYIWLLTGRISKNQLMQETYGTRWMKKHYPDVLPPIDQKDALDLLSRRWNYEKPQFCKDEIKRLEVEYKHLFSD